MVEHTESKVLQCNLAIGIGLARLTEFMLAAVSIGNSINALFHFHDINFILK